MILKLTTAFRVEKGRDNMIQLIYFNYSLRVQDFIALNALTTIQRCAARRSAWLETNGLNDHLIISGACSKRSSLLQYKLTVSFLYIINLIVAV